MMRLPAIATAFLLACGLAAAQDPSNELLKKAFKAIDAKDFKQAATHLENAIKINPRNATAYGNLGYVYAVLNRQPEALAHSEKCIELDPKSTYSYVNAAVYAANLSEFTKLKRYGKHVLTLPKGVVKPNDLKLVKTLLEDLQPRVYTVDWTLDIKDAWGEGGRAKGPFHIAIPATDLPYQTSTLAVRGAKSHEIVKRDGVQILKFDSDGPVELTATVTVRFVDARPKLKSLGKGSTPEDVKLYLGAGSRLDPTSAKVRAVAEKTWGNTPLKTIENLLVWLKGNMKYEHPTSFETVDEVIQRGNGDCGAYSALFVVVCRANGIPAREVWGVTKASERFAPKGHLSSHVWAEVYLDGIGWVSVEPQNLNGLGHQPTGYVRLMHQVTLAHDWPNTLKSANAVLWFGKPATIPKFTEKLLPE